MHHDLVLHTAAAEEDLKATFTASSPPRTGRHSGRPFSHPATNCCSFGVYLACPVLSCPLDCPDNTARLGLVAPTIVIAIREVPIVY